MVRPEQPLLFYLDGPDMRWRSAATIAEQVDSGRRALDALGLARGAVVAYSWQAGPDAVVADLAIRSGGWTARPLAGGGTGEAGEAGDAPSAAARLLLPFEDPATAEGLAAPSPDRPAAQPAPSVRLPRPETELSARRDRGETGAPLPAVAELPGGACIRGPEWRVASAEELAAAARRLAGLLADREASPGRRRRERPVVVACLDPTTPDGRTVLDWALAADAALYLEPDAWALGTITGWCRPMVVAGDGRGLASLAAEMRRREGGARPLRGLRRWLRGVGERARGGARGSGDRPPAGRFGRLRVAIFLGSRGSGGLDGSGGPGWSGNGGARLGADDLALFARHGVALVVPEDP